jgi:hypothetical protein
MPITGCALQVFYIQRAMQIAYFSHSYRPVDTYVVDHFAKLMRSTGVTPSLDPPSDKVNGAKLERHLNASDGMVAILTVRDGGVSPHILYEINLCRRARKPLLVFVEDCLSNDLVPPRILQYRFSRASLLRQVREHQHGFKILKQYLGADPPPRYQPSASRQTCLLLGFNTLAPDNKEAIRDQLDTQGYEPIVLDLTPRQVNELALYEDIAHANLVVHFVDDLSPAAHYTAGILHTALVPNIAITCSSDYLYDQFVPKEYQPKQVISQRATDLEIVLQEELRVYSQDFLDLEDQEEVAKYADLLLAFGAPQRRHDPDIRNYIIRNVNNMSDQYNINQAGAAGPNAHVNNSTFNQIASGVNSSIDVQKLAEELTMLRQSLSQKAAKPEEFIELGHVASAEKAAIAGESNKAVHYLKQAGSWVWETATKIGVEVAIQAAKTSLGA